MNKAASPQQVKRMRTTGWRARVALFLLIMIAVSVVVITNRLLTDRFTENTRNRAELRLVLYGGNLLSELRQNAIVPQLLARDPTLISALNSADFTQSTARLISFLDEIGAKSLILLDSDGRAVATTEREQIGQSHRQAAYFIDATRSADTVFKVLENETGTYGFFYSRRLESQNQLIGVIVVEVDLAKYERAWRAFPTRFL